jgi:Putative glycolipid-binding
VIGAAPSDRAVRSAARARATAGSGGRPRPEVDDDGERRHAAARVGESVDLPVAWIDVDLAAVVELPQRYKRIGPHEYAYDSPTVPYSATFEIAPNGFALTYPRLWQAVTTG